MSTINSAPTERAISANLRVVDFAGIGTGTGDDQFRLVFAGLAGDVIEVDAMVALADAVRHHVVKLPGEIHRAAVRQVSALGQVHREIGVARLEHGEVDRHVGLRTGVRLDVGVLAAEELAGPIGGPVLRSCR